MAQNTYREKANITKSALLALTDHTIKMLDIEKERYVASFIDTMIRENVPLVMIRPLLQKSDIIYTSNFDEKVLLLTEQIENFALERNDLITNETKEVSEEEPDSTEPKEGPSSSTNKRKTDLTEPKEGPESPMKKRTTDLDSIFGSDSDDDDSTDSKEGPESSMKKRKPYSTESKEGPESPVKKKKTDLELYLPRKGFTESKEPVNHDVDHDVDHDDHDDYSTEPKKGFESPISNPKPIPVNLGEEFANVDLSPEYVDLSPFSERYLM